MRLLNVDSFEFTDFSGNDRPPYVAASHRWHDEETTYQDVRHRRNTARKGYRKVEAFARYLQENLPSIKWLWIDTCCINKENAAELSEAINLMFEWYRDAGLCLAYLGDVDTAEDLTRFEESVWFKRGWTLQELLAPSLVLFVTEKWQVIGHKGSQGGELSAHVGPDLEQKMANFTKIPAEVLSNYTASQDLSDTEKLKWMDGRTTSRQEDMWYALYGILGVSPGANYGERYEGARQRFFAAIHQRDNVATQKAELFRNIVSWLSPPDPWSNHESARRRHEPQTGIWLLEDARYRDWKTASAPRLLWVHGKAGSGKTILCSTTIEDTRSYCKATANSGHAFFYFSFSDIQKQTYPNMLHSLVSQLGWKEPSASILRRAYQSPGGRPPGVDELQEIFMAALTSYDQVFVHLDALDECPEQDEVRDDVLDGLRAMSGAKNLHLLVTSRDVPDVRAYVEGLSAESFQIAVENTDRDIRQYVATQLSHNRKLSRLGSATKTLVEETLARKADGMFRWAYCQLQALKESKSTGPASVRAALLSLPKDLDDTYERMLLGIGEADRLRALTLLRWLAYAMSPPSLEELAEAGIIDPTDDPTADGVINVNDKGACKDVLEILTGFIIVEDNQANETVSLYDKLYPRPKDKVRLAHFSIKEYLESPRILASEAKIFYLDPAREHTFLTQSCLVYLRYYSLSSLKSSSLLDLTTFPLLHYAAKSWFLHARLQQQHGGSSPRVLSILDNTSFRRDWLSVHNADNNGDYNRMKPFEFHVFANLTGLYCASLLGLEEAVEALLTPETNLDAESGYFSSALNVAAEFGHDRMAKLLIQAGADVNAQSSLALETAAGLNHGKIAEYLIEAGTNVNVNSAQDGGPPLYWASLCGNANLVAMMIAAGADLDAGEASLDLHLWWR